MFKTNLKENFPNFLAFVLLTCSFLFAQDNLIIENININTSESFSASSITIGPNVTVESEGDLELNSSTLAIKAEFFIVEGGQLQIISGSPPVNIEKMEEIVLPEHFKVGQNYPNPFNPQTYINYELPKTEFVEIIVYNLTGQKIKVLMSGQQAAGSYTITWDGRDRSGNQVSSGIYYYQVSAGNNTISKKMTFIK